MSTAPNRLASMIDQILGDDPGVTIVVAQMWYDMPVALVIGRAECHYDH